MVMVVTEVQECNMKQVESKIHIASCSFGKDSLASILIALEHNEPLDKVVFAEVMFDHERGISGEIPEHIEWVYSTAIPKLAEMGVKVDVVKSKKDYIHFFRSAVGGGGIKAKFMVSRLVGCVPLIASAN